MARVWADARHRRFFAIPAESALPAGDFELRAITGAERVRVTEAAAATHEITRAEATRLLGTQLGDAVERVGGDVREAIAGWARGREAPPWSVAGQRQARASEAQRGAAGPAAGQGPDAPPAPPTAAHREPAARAASDTETPPGLALLAALAHRSADALAHDPRALREALGEVTTNLGVLVRDALDPQTLDGARERAHALGEALRAHGLAAADSVDGLPDALAEMAHVPAEARHAAAERLQRAAEHVRALGTRAADGLELLAESMAEPMAEPEPPQPD